MDPLSTDNLEHLLNISAPEPWHFCQDVVDTPSGIQDIIHEVYTPTEPELFSISGGITDIYLNVCQKTARSLASPMNDPTNVVH